MAIDYATLKTEIQNDVRGYGYAPFVAKGDDNAVRNLLNAIRDGTNPPSNPTADGGAANGAITIRKNDVSSKDIWEAIDINDFPALPASPTAAQLSQERRALAWMEGLSNIPAIRLLNNDGTDNPVVTNLKAMFPNGSGTRTRLVALAQRYGSRSEEKYGVMVTSSDVSMALRGMT